MKVKYALFSAIIAMSSGVSVANQTKSSSGEARSISAKGNETEVALKQKLLSLKSFIATFSQTVTDAQKQVLQTSEGTISLKQPNKMLWEVSEPNENTLLADGKTLWHIDPFVEQVVAMDQEKAVINNPVMLLTSPDSEAWDDFVISHDGRAFLVDAKGEESQVVRLELVFENDILTMLTFVDRQQQRSELIFADIQQNTEVGGQVFNFSLPAGFDLDDQRL